VEILGRAPVVNDTTLAGLRAAAKNNKDQGVPNIPQLSAWNDEEYNSKRQSVIDEYANVDFRLYEDFYRLAPSMMRTEEPRLTQDLYAELTKVIQAVVTDKNANVQALLDVANSNLQKLLDAQ
jgi:hypothetical protein